MFGKEFCLNEYYPDGHDTIWRYMQLWKLVHLITRRRLFLARGDQFDDPLEGMETKLSKGIRAKVQGKFNFGSNSSLYERNRRCVAISCWYVGEHECQEMWNKFAPGLDGVAIRSSVANVRESLSEHRDKLCIRKMEYVEHHDLEFTKFGCPFYPFSIKCQTEFQSESELRIIYGDGKGCKAGSPQYKAPELDRTGIELQMNPSALIHSVIISPDASECILTLVKSLVKCLNIDVEVEYSVFKDG